jgi:thioredoxin reductase
MTENKSFDVIIIGGSFAGLSAAMSLGRSLRKVLIIDSGEPCNRQTPYTHNFLTRDGQKPTEILAIAKEQVLKYGTVQFYNGVAINGRTHGDGFEIETQSQNIFYAKKLVIATGIKDLLPEIPGFHECWGISILHCPYCHGYEVRNQKTALVGNGDALYHFTQLVTNWTKEIIVFTNGPSALAKDQTKSINKHHIQIIETEIEGIDHENGFVKNIVLNDNSKVPVNAVYTRPPFVQHSDIPQQLACKFTQSGLIEVDPMQRTSLAGIYACGDNSFGGRSVAAAVSSGSIAGAMANKELIEEQF